MVHIIILAQIPTPPSRVDCHLILDFMTHLLMPSLSMESSLFPSASYYSHQWCYHRLSKYSGIFLDRLKDWVNGEFKAKPIEVLLRDFSATAEKEKKAPCFWGKAKIMMFKRKKSWICLCILLWMLKGSSSLAGEAANPARGREKWRHTKISPIPLANIYSMIICLLFHFVKSGMNSVSITCHQNILIIQIPKM